MILRHNKETMNNKAGVRERVQGNRKRKNGKATMRNKRQNTWIYQFSKWGKTL